MGRFVIATIVCFFEMLYCFSTTASEPPTLQMIIDGIKKTEGLVFESKSMLIRCERTKSETVTRRTPNAGDLLLME